MDWHRTLILSDMGVAMQVTGCRGKSGESQLKTGKSGTEPAGRLADLSRALLFDIQNRP